jgi:drug/metabolite transporter (DMT)-like permease
MPQSDPHHSQFTQRQRIIAFVLALVGAVLFSNKAVLAKLMYREGADALDVITLRMIFAAPLFIALTVWVHFTDHEHSNYRLTMRDAWQIILVGFVGYYLSSMLDFSGLQYISTGLERLLLFLTSSLVLIISHVFLKKKIDPKQWWAMVLAYAGIVLVFVHEVQFSGDHVWLGSTLVFGSALSYAIYLLMTGELVKHLGAARLVAYAMLVSTFCCLVQYGVQRDWPHLLDLLQTHPMMNGYAVMIAVFCTFMPILLTMFAVGRLGSPIVSQIGMVGPISMLVSGFWLLGEPITATQLTGTALVLLGMTLVGRLATQKITAHR